MWVLAVGATALNGEHASATIFAILAVAAIGCADGVFFGGSEAHRVGGGRLLTDPAPLRSPRSVRSVHCPARISLPWPQAASQLTVFGLKWLLTANIVLRHSQASADAMHGGRGRRLAFSVLSPSSPGLRGARARVAKTASTALPGARRTWPGSGGLGAQPAAQLD
jgi:hypothetical protein